MNTVWITQTSSFRTLYCRTLYCMLMPQSFSFALTSCTLVEVSTTTVPYSILYSTHTPHPTTVISTVIMLILYCFEVHEKEYRWCLNVQNHYSTFTQGCSICDLDYQLRSFWESSYCTIHCTFPLSVRFYFCTSTTVLYSYCTGTRGPCNTAKKSKKKHTK